MQWQRTWWRVYLWLLMHWMLFMRRWNRRVSLWWLFWLRLLQFLTPYYQCHLQRRVWHILSQSDQTQKCKLRHLILLSIRALPQTIVVANCHWQAPITQLKVRLKEMTWIRDLERHQLNDSNSLLQLELTEHNVLRNWQSVQRWLNRPSLKA